MPFRKIIVKPKGVQCWSPLSIRVKVVNGNNYLVVAGRENRPSVLVLLPEFTAYEICYDEEQYVEFSFKDDSWLKIYCKAAPGVSDEERKKEVRYLLSVFATIANMELEDFTIKDREPVEEELKRNIN